MSARRSARARDRGGATSSMDPEKLVEFLEAVYALELDDEAWLRAVAAATREVWGRPASTWASFVDASDVRAVRPTLTVTEGVPEELAAIFVRAGQSMSPALAERLHRRCAAGALRQTAPELIPALDRTAAFGIAD